MRWRQFAKRFEFIIVIKPIVEVFVALKFVNSTDELAYDDGGYVSRKIGYKLRSIIHRITEFIPMHRNDPFLSCHRRAHCLIIVILHVYLHEIESNDDEHNDNC